MCGRSSLTKTEKELEERFQSTFYSEELERYNPLPNFNVAPTHYHPVITNEDPDHFRFFRWGLIPFWAKDSKIGYKMINARVETVAEKASFKNALKKRRCLVPFDGYYEWQKTPNGKKPYRIKIKSEDVFCVAGLWENWKDPQGNWWHTFTLITQDASPSVHHIHDRMPGILHPRTERMWIDNTIPPEEALKLISPYPDDDLMFYRVSPRVGKVSENDEDLIKPIEEQEAPPLFEE